LDVVGNLHVKHKNKADYTVGHLFLNVSFKHCFSLFSSGFYFKFHCEVCQQTLVVLEILLEGIYKAVNNFHCRFSVPFYDVG
jgi:hypothetical protein